MLQDKLGMKEFHLLWVPHAASANQHGGRVSCSKLVLTALTECKPTEFEQVVTGDESWFFMYYARGSVWTVSRGDLPHRIKHKSEPGKSLISIPWSKTAIHSLCDAPKRTTYNTAFFTDRYTQFEGEYYVKES
jgi:hypothetical protein